MLNEPAPEPAPPDSTRIIMLALRRALLLIVSTIEQVYGLDPKDRIVVIIERG